MKGSFGRSLNAYFVYFNTLVLQENKKNWQRVGFEPTTKGL
jgi:hypothetical protein